MRMRLGEILMAQGAIDEYQLRSALGHQRSFQTPLGRVLIDRGFCQPEAVLKALAVQQGVATVQLETQELDRSLTSLIPSRIAHQYRVIPLSVDGERADRLSVAMAAPISLEAIDAVRAVSGKRRVEAQLASDEEIDAALKLLYDDGVQVEPFGKTVHIAPTKKHAEPVLIYGWNPQATRTLALWLRAQGVATVEATSLQVATSRKDAILIAPLPVVEQMKEQRQLGQAQMVVAVKDPKRDLTRAQEVGARAYLGTPVNPELLLRAVRRLRPDSPAAEQSQEIQALFPLLPRVA